MDDQLKQLLDYTKFHIGMYTTLATLLIGVLTLDKVPLVHASYSGWLFVALLCLLAAGMAGGMVGSSIPDHKKYDDFMTTGLGPWGTSWMRAAAWIHIEHTAFWLGIAIAVAGLFVTRRALTG